jgi:phosphoribosylanthranilate isomerase
VTARVKICGLSTPETMEAALEAGADYVGLVFFPRSPRHVEMAAARELAMMASGTADVVALLVDPDDALVGRIAAELGPDIIQLHGK